MNPKGHECPQYWLYRQKILPTDRQTGAMLNARPHFMKGHKNPTTANITSRPGCLCHVYVQLTAIVSNDGLVSGGKHPHHNCTVLGSSDYVTVLVQITLWPCYHSHHTKVAIYHLQNLPWRINNNNVDSTGDMSPWKLEARQGWKS